MTVKQSLSPQTRRNWIIDAALLSSAVISGLSGIYFLFLPYGGYQGGRNPMYGVQVIFERNTWDDLHTWGGVIMISVAAIHLALHWTWVTSMIRRTIQEIQGKCGCMNRRGRSNLILNAVVAFSFLVTAASGVYFLAFPGGRGAVDPGILFARSTWDAIHTWAGVTLIAAGVLHLLIHWKWVVKVTRSLLAGILSAGRNAKPASAQLA